MIKYLRDVTYNGKKCQVWRCTCGKLHFIPIMEIIAYSCVLARCKLNGCGRVWDIPTPTSTFDEPVELSACRGAEIAGEM